MRNLHNKWVKGAGSPSNDINARELREIIVKAFAEIECGKRVLAIIPDQTRDDLTPIIFPIAAEILYYKSVERFDALVAQGTHAPMSDIEKQKKIGADKFQLPPNFGVIYDHEWDSHDALTLIGQITAERVNSLSNNAFADNIQITINRKIVSADYDTILIFSSTVPHEVAGFSGGAKYFFPGVSGRELTDATHWIGALAGIENVIGKIDTPTRRLINAATEFIEKPVVCLNAVVSRTAENRLRTHAFFVGDVQTAFLKAAEVSGAVHIKFVGRKYRRVVAILDGHYDELWVGGKASYKLGGIIEPGGELIIYAPHLKAISATHGAAIERFGYAPIETVRQLVAENADLRGNLCVAAHLAHVAYAGRALDDGTFVPRFSIKLASALDEETCRRVNFEFLDWRAFDLESYADDADTLVVERAGRDLYLVG